MLLIKPSYQIETPIDGDRILRSIERIGRTCYKSEDKITEDSAKEFCRKAIARGHESVIEHENLSIRFIVDRGVSHELVRHRLCSFSQESTRYCNYTKDDHIVFIIPPWCAIDPGTFDNTNIPTIEESGSGWWVLMMQYAELYYHKLIIQYNWSPQQARSVLPNSTKTELVMTANLREWRHILRLRTSKAAHPQMREVMIPLLEELKEKIPVLFDDIN